MSGPTLDPDAHSIVDDHRRWWLVTANSFAAAALVVEAGPDGANPSEDGGSVMEALPPELLNARVRFWQCPVPEHRARRDVVTVEWRADVAHCTADGCAYTSVNSLPVKALADVAALRTEIGEYGSRRIIARTAAPPRPRPQCERDRAEPAGRRAR